MKFFKGGAPSRAQYLLSKFIFSDTHSTDHGRTVRHMTFNHVLPPAYTLSASIKTAMELEGLTVVNDDPPIEITDEQAHNINYLIKLFSAVDPVRVDGKTHYHYYINKLFSVAIDENDAAKVIASYASYQKPTPIAGVYQDAEIFTAVHTALRKLCDSKITSAAWNAFQNLSPETVKWVVEPIAKVMGRENNHQTAEGFVDMVKKACLDADYMCKYEQAMIHCLYELFDDNDWHGYLSYLINWEVSTISEVK